MLISRMVAMQKLTSRFCLSTAHFCQVAEEILTQHSTKNALQRNTSFNVKLHVPVGFWGMCNLDQLTHSPSTVCTKVFLTAKNKYLLAAFQIYALERPRNVLRYAQIALIAVIAFMYTSDNKMHYITLFLEVNFPRFVKKLSASRTLDTIFENSSL